MTTKRIEIEARKDLILGITVSQYIKTISPVGSNFIANEYKLNVSSATIRNILAELEKDGYLTHPHTSAGRIPTQKGYRYYVDHLMMEIELLEEEKDNIKAEYRKESRELEALLEKTCRVISETTHYTSLISLDGERKMICQGTNYVVNYPEYQDVEKISNILAALEEKERIIEMINRQLQSRVDIFIGEEISVNEMEQCSLVVSPYKTKQGASGRVAVLGPTRMDYQRVVCALDYVRELMEEF